MGINGLNDMMFVGQMLSIYIHERKGQKVKGGTFFFGPV